MGGEERGLRVDAEGLHGTGELRRNQHFRDDKELGGGIIAAGEMETEAEETNVVGGWARLPSAG